MTIGDDTYKLPEPFLVLATQNPLEQEGTYPLPEAQVDRFMLKAKISYPQKQEERDIMRMNLAGEGLPKVNKVTSPEDIVKARRVVEEVYMDEKIEKYIIDIIFATREPAEYNLEKLHAEESGRPLCPPGHGGPVIQSLRPGRPERCGQCGGDAA